MLVERLIFKSQLSGPLRAGDENMPWGRGPDKRHSCGPVVLPGRKEKFFPRGVEARALDAEFVT